MLLRVFQAQVHLQCQAVVIAAQDLQRAFTVGSMPWAWVAIQNLLTASANISKALWGQGGRLAEPRQPLRASLTVADDSPLKDVGLRNDFEHYDERLDSWWRTSASHNHLDMSILAPESVQGLADSDMFRVYDPTTGHLVFWGKRFDIRAIVTEVERILPIASAEARKPHWDPGNSP